VRKVRTRSSSGSRHSEREAHQGGAEGANIFHVRGGKVTRVSIYRGRERALADLGLME